MRSARAAVRPTGAVCRVRPGHLRRASRARAGRYTVEQLRRPAAAPASRYTVEPREDQMSILVLTFSMTASVNSVVPAWPPRSTVRVPPATVSSVPS